MSLAALLRRTPRQLDQDDADAAAELEANDAVRRRQLLWLSGAGGVALVLGSLYIFDGDEPKLAKDTAGQEIAVSTDDLVNRNMSQREWMAASEGRLQSIDNRLKAVDGQAAQVQQFEAQLAAIRAENQSMTSDGQRVMSAYQAENDQLRAALTAAKAPPSAASPGAMYGASAPIYQPSGAGATPAGEGALTAVAAASPTATVKLVAFEAGPAGAATRVAGGSTSYTTVPTTCRRIRSPRPV
jgi:conjugal transfer pilus assembly protein TraB